MVKFLSKHHVFEELCRTSGKWGLYISFSDLDTNDELISWEYGLFKAAPYLKTNEDMDYEHICVCEQICSDGWGILLFDTEEEMEKYYNLTVGDDGPTDTNPYNGDYRVYALTCDPIGQLLTENT